MEVFVGFLPLALGRLHHALESGDEAVRDEVQPFCLAVVFQCLFIILQLVERIGAQQVCVGKVFIGEGGIVAGVDGLAVLPLFVIAAGYAIPVEGRVGILVNQFVVVGYGFVQVLQGKAVVGAQGKVSLVVGIFFPSPSVSLSSYREI